MSEKRLDILQDEAREIGRRVEAAAAAKDVDEYMLLTMRRDALPLLIRNAEAAPILAEIKSLDREVLRLESEIEAIRTGPPPEVPVPARGTVTVEMRRNQLLQAAGERRMEAASELKQARKRLAQMEQHG